MCVVYCVLWPADGQDIVIDHLQSVVADQADEIEHLQTALQQITSGTGKIFCRIMFCVLVKAFCCIYLSSLSFLFKLTTCSLSVARIYRLYLKQT